MALLNTNIGPERVQVFPKALGTLPIPGAGISTAAFVISTSYVSAPEQTVVAVRSLEEFVDTFGGPDEVANGAYYAVKGYYDNGGTGNTAYIVNVGESPSVSDYIGNSGAGTGLRAFDAIDDLGLVMVPGLPLAEAYLVQSALVDYTETIRTEFGATLSTSFSLLAMPTNITRANTDETLVTAQLIEITGSGPWVMDLQTESTATAASGTVTVTNFGNLVSGDDDTVEVAGVVFTAQVGAVTPGDPTFQAASSNDDTAASLADQINAHATASALVTAEVEDNVVTITANAVGVAGNSLTLVYTDNDTNVGATVSGSGTLTGGTAGNVALTSVTPGMVVKNQAGTYTGVISQVNNSTDTVTVTPDPSTFFDPGDDVFLVKPSAVTYKNSVVTNSSAKTAAWYFNPAVVIDESEDAESGDLLVVDPIGHVAGVVARIDAQTNIGGVSHAPAGQQYAGIAGINGLALLVSERLDAAPLRLNFINRITSFPGVGPIIFGGYTADVGGTPSFTADEQLIQVIRTLQFIKASLEPGLRAFIWENFSPETQGQVAAAIESFLRNNSYLFPAGLPETSQFVVASVEPTTDELNQGLLRVRVQVRPNKAVRFVEIALEFPIPDA